MLGFDVMLTKDMYGTDVVQLGGLVGTAQPKLLLLSILAVLWVFPNAHSFQRPSKKEVEN